MSKKNNFKWGWKDDEWSMGEVAVKEYSTRRDGSGKMKLEVSIPVDLEMTTGRHLKKLLAKKYKSVILTPDRGNTNFLQMSFANIKA